MRRLARRREHKLTINSGATSNFVFKDLDLPKDRVSNKEVFLPDNSKLRTLHKTKLPFKQLSCAAREAHILPGLKRSLLSVNKMSEEGYTAIFHLGEEGASINKKGTLTITTSKPLVLQGCKSNQEKLWTVSANLNDQISEEANNVYSLPSIPQTITYLHAATGFPVKEIWMGAIKAGIFIAWPSLTTLAVQKHFPDSNENLKGYMKKHLQKS
jgi:hypothetical protein